MIKSILIIGMPGVGKTTIAMKLKEMGLNSIDIEGVDGLYKMINRLTKEPFSNFDDDNLEMVKQSEWICDEEKIKEIVNSNINKTTFYCGIASNLENFIDIFDQVLFLDINHEELIQRLNSRTTNTFAKTKEVQNWLPSWSEKWKQQMIEKGATLVSANGSIESTIENILKEVGVE